MTWTPNLWTTDHKWLQANTRADGNENVVDLHPILAHRARQLIRDVWSAEGDGSALIESGVRARAEQEYLYRLRQAGRYSAAVANPWRPAGTIPDQYGAGPIAVVGSYHMPQSDGFGHAVDIIPAGPLTQRYQRRADAYAAIHAVWNREPGRYGLALTVPNEPWHFQAASVSLGGWLDGPIPITEGVGDEVLPSEREAPQMQMYYDEGSKLYTIHMDGIGTSDPLDADPTHWRQVIETGAKTGVYKSQYMDELIAKIRAAERARQ